MTGTAPPDASGAATGAADERLTADRNEVKYLMGRDRLTVLAAALARRLPSHRFTGEGANHLPDPHSFVTTVYFDTPSRAHLHAARDDWERNVKVRAKEYYDLHPSLAELATDPEQIVRYQPWLWFELKRRQGLRTSKLRFRLRKRDVPAFFGGGQVDLAAMTPPSDDPAAPAAAGQQEGLRGILEHCRSLPEPLSAACLVNYRRLSWQSRGGETGLRVTVDLDLGFFAPPADLWTRQRALVRSALGPVRGGEARAVVEVKSLGTLPAWLEDLMAEVGAVPTRYSKFLNAAERLNGHGAAATGAGPATGQGPEPGHG
jgi:hypothetical protein